MHVAGDDFLQGVCVHTGKRVLTPLSFWNCWARLSNGYRDWWARGREGQKDGKGPEPDVVSGSGFLSRDTRHGAFSGTGGVKIVESHQLVSSGRRVLLAEPKR